MPPLTTTTAATATTARSARASKSRSPGPAQAAAARQALPAPPTPALLDGPPVEERIRRRAYELYEQRGGGDGRAMDDWLAAESELRGH